LRISKKRLNKYALQLTLLSRWVWLYGVILLVVGCSGSSNPPGTTPVGELRVTGIPDDTPCFQEDSEVTILTTSTGLEFVRSPNSCFEALPDFDYAPNYVEIDGLRMHYVDAGPADGEVVLLLHGQPSWSYLYRKMIPVFVDAGYRVIAADHIGMGRSDKPVDPTIHQYEQQVLWMKAFIEQLALRDINLFVQDWGSLIGLRVAGDMPDLFARIVLANGDLPVIPEGANPFVLPDFEIDESYGDAFSFFSTRSAERIQGFQEWIDYAAGAPNLVAGDVINFGSLVPLTEEEKAAYNAPYPSLVYKGAIRAFPSMVSGIEMESAAAFNTLGMYTNPFMALAGESDPNLGSEVTQNKWINHVPGAAGQDHRRFNAAHFIQEDVGESMAAHVVQFMANTSPTGPQAMAGPLFNFRYCEILLVYPEDGALEAEVWGTQGVNDCPQALWDGIDFVDIAAEYDALLAINNGPRYFVVDLSLGGSLGTPDGEPQRRDYGGLTMQLLAASVTIGTPPAGAGSGANRYAPASVARSNTWVLNPGRRIYELMDVSGQRWVMQSFSQAVDPEQSLDDLLTLGDRLDLPSGWTWATRVLSSPLEVRTVDGVAQVLQDELANTYQLLQ
jgi:pimeloyl-ACP methyl ester carboxylesterase